MYILGLVLLIVAVAIGVAGVVTNTGTSHMVGGEFSVFGVHMTGSTGALFLVGIVVGAAGMLGLSMVLAASRRRVRQSRQTRRELERTQAALNVDRGDAAAPTRAQSAPDTAPRMSRSWKHPFGGAARSTPSPSH